MRQNYARACAPRPAPYGHIEDVLPRYHEDGNAMLAVIARMREQPAKVKREFVSRANDWTGGWRDQGNLLLHLTPEAVCAAALACLAAREGGA